ncbi:28S ribosomal protein S18c, mitochondrial isoform X1 [Alosa sapidissima]|uniref:28S ribosomal protein S18c, mitochondrial isoform X1 n=2 Tax=Alosa TaxID=34772 RepID=UPI001C08F061|nr:28S ribosomal protein S18c, mitochondrial isoform X1 [Alosa sapidissima]
MFTKMLALRSCRTVFLNLSQAGFKRQVAEQASRSVSVAADEDHKDMPIKIENPFKEPQKGCILCSNEIKVDYKNIQLLSQFISPHTGRIYGRHITGLCGRRQKEISKAIKRAHAMGFMSVTLKDPQFMKDPNICDIKHLE